MKGAGRIGVWLGQFAGSPAGEVRSAAAAIEELGYRTLWFPEGFGREAFTTAALLLQATTSVTVASGIASIWARDATATANAGRSLAEAYGGRFVLGLGVSHESMVSPRGADYDAPFSAMRRYLDDYDNAVWRGPEVEPPPVVLAALGPRMLRLAAERTAGAHPYFVPVEHTELARETMGDAAWLAPEQMVVTSPDPAEALSIARKMTRYYLALPNYRRNLLRLGWPEEELEGEGSDRLVEAIVAWGEPDDIAGRVAAHLRAGADHVAVQVLLPDRSRFPLAELENLAPALLALEEPM